MKHITSSSVIDHLEDLPIGMLGHFIVIEKVNVSKKKKSRLIEKACLEYLVEHNENISNGNDGSYIIDDQDFIERMTKAYELFTSKKSSKYEKGLIYKL